MPLLSSNKHTHTRTHTRPRFPLFLRFLAELLISVRNELQKRGECAKKKAKLSTTLRIDRLLSLTFTPFANSQWLTPLTQTRARACMRPSTHAQRKSIALPQSCERQHFATGTNCESNYSRGVGALCSCCLGAGDYPFSCVCVCVCVCVCSCFAHL